MDNFPERSTYEDWWNSLDKDQRDELLRNHYIPAETPEEVDTYLRSQGYDPEQLVKTMRARIEAISKAAQARLDKDGHL